MEKKGIPLAVYHDRHGIFERSALEEPQTREEQLRGQEPTTQMGRLLKELGVESIPAYSPQAKGRIERLFKTLQDRLGSELRLAQAKTLEEAQRVLKAFLPRFNRRFSVPRPCRIWPTVRFLLGGSWKKYSVLNITGRWEPIM